MSDAQPMEVGAASSARVFAVVLTRNGDETATACVEAARASTGVAVDFVVVDNGSADGSADRLTHRFGSERVLRLSDNTGYVGGMNAGLRRWLDRGDCPYVLLLTHDTRVAPDAVRRMVAALEADAAIGLAGPLVFYHGDGDRLFSAGGRIEPRRRRIRHLQERMAAEPYGVDWIDGCCMLIRREVIEQIGALDERFFIYFEEVDLCCRATAAGWSIRVVPQARASQRKELLQAPYYSYYTSRNGYLFWRKNYGAGAPRVAVALAGQALRFTGWAVLSALAPGLPRSERGRRLRAVPEQLRGVALGTRDHLRSRYGRAREWG